jgi:hypothetical protein
MAASAKLAAGCSGLLATGGAAAGVDEMRPNTC